MPRGPFYLGAQLIDARLCGAGAKPRPPQPIVGVSNSFPPFFPPPPCRFGFDSCRGDASLCIERADAFRCLPPSGLNFLSFRPLRPRVCDPVFLEGDGQLMRSLGKWAALLLGPWLCPCGSSFHAPSAPPFFHRFPNHKKPRGPADGSPGGGVGDPLAQRRNPGWVLLVSFSPPFFSSPGVAVGSAFSGHMVLNIKRIFQYKTAVL